MFSRIFIERPRLAAVVSLVIFIAGALCMTKLSVEEYPDIAPPSIYVGCSYSGCSAETVRDVIATQLDAEINGVEDMLYFSSTCSNEGRYSCNISFKTGVDSDIAMVNVQNAIKAAEAKLPSEVQKTGVTVRKRSSDTLGVFSFSTDGSVMSAMEMNNWLSTTVADAISRVDGVSSVDAMGGDVYAMRVWLDPLRMAGLGVTISEVTSAIETQNIQAAAGTLGAEQSNEFLQFKINVQGRLKTAEEFGDIVVRSMADGSILRLKDIARVELGAKTYTSRSICDGQKACGLMVYRNNDSNALATMNRVKALLEDMSKRFPQGVTYVIANDPTKFIVVTLKEIVLTIFIALTLVILVTYVFLQDWRATLVPAIAIPVALVGTFTFMYLMDYSINVLSMFGLILVIGSLVDDAIVVVENCQGLMEREGLSAKQAALKSMQQITGAIISTTLVTIACYVPLAFYGGMVGQIYMQFSVTMCVSLVLSTVVAMTLSPALCALILRPPAKTPPKVFKPFNSALEWIKARYLKGVNMLVKHAWLTIALFACVCAGIYGISKITPSSFLPEEDKGIVMMNIELAPGASTLRTQATLERLRERIMRVDGVEGVMMMPGNSMMSGSGEHVAMGFIRLKDWSVRTSDETQLSTIVSKLQQNVNDLPEANVIFFTPPAIMGLGAVGGVSAVLCGEGDVDAQEFSKIVKQVVAQINSWPEVRRASSSYNADTMQLFLEIDRTKAETLGVRVSSIFSALQTQLASLYVNDFNFAGDAFYVKVQSSKEFRVTQQDILSLLVGNDQGEQVPLSSFAKISYMVGPTQIQRFNKLTSADISVQPTGEISSGDMIAKLENMDLPSGFHFEWSGQSYQERQNQGQLMLIMSLALLFAYLFLVAQYESWTIPMPVMLTVAVPILGAFAGLWISGLSLSIYAQLGMVMLIGLSAKNAILMIEFSKQSHEQGFSIHDASLMGASLRFRAVLMTAWSFLFGVFPLVVATGAGAGSRRAIGITTFSGMLLATLVGIMFAPALYSLFSRMRETVRKANVPEKLLPTPPEFQKFHDKK